MLGAQNGIPRLVKMQTLIARFDGRCVYCGKDVNNALRHPHPDAPSRDHFIPISKGGSRGAKNTVLACCACNSAKGDIDPRLILYAWLCLDPGSLREATLRINAPARPCTRLH